MQRPTNAMRRAASARLQRVTVVGNATTARRFTRATTGATVGGELLDSRPVPAAAPVWAARRLPGPGALDMSKMSPAEIKAYCEEKYWERVHERARQIEKSAAHAAAREALYALRAQIDLEDEGL